MKCGLYSAECLSTAQESPRFKVSTRKLTRAEKFTAHLFTG